MSEEYKVVLQLVEDNKGWIYDKLVNNQLVFDDDFKEALTRPFENYLTDAIEEVLHISCYRQCCETIHEGWRGATCKKDVYEEIHHDIEEIIKNHYELNYR